MKNEINKTMKEIAKRKLGKKKLVYQKSTKTIVIVDRANKVIEDTGITIHDV